MPDQPHGGRGRPARGKVLDAALALLREGPEALTVRRIAAELGTSTQAIYTSHGGKFGLVSEIYTEGYRRLRDELARAAAGAGDDLEARLIAIARAYRDFALANPELFQVMFCNVIPGFHPDPATLEETWQAYVVLSDAVREAVDSGIWHGDPDSIARLLWQTVHGQAQLEVAGYLGRGPEGVEQQTYALETLGAALRAGNASPQTRPPPEPGAASPAPGSAEPG
ncbi:AcrR family transcriptional regulator [Lipingzhangella halophila]|uniref:AcrR family transcriptional regulator n=1 Tax=Lipingzhangella halophila TaxID=1783352 RepID=A0A7W7RJB8_9ACTN|nr:TetR/AcrR family transcriptional regulator [Lipingzhangella halophila]MBB4932990.1 AcrR family transcriptional regulator [Lipingzhangella halophila]